MEAHTLGDGITIYIPHLVPKWKKYNDAVEVMMHPIDIDTSNRDTCLTYTYIPQPMQKRKEASIL